MKTPYEIIDAKKLNQYLSYEEIKFFVQGYVDGSVSSAQMAAFLMAVRLNSMSVEETAALTDVMAFSGKTIDTSSIENLIDKHSTGGVGDKTSFVIGSVLNALGLCVGMMSGRGLGHTGGTLDKLESIAGFRSDLDDKQYLEILKDTGFSIIAQTKDIAPADKLMYALRNETATIDSIPLIAASIMSKKIASGTQNIVLDVKYGDGAFMKTKEEANELAQVMEGIAQSHNIVSVSQINSMEDVLGNFVGNALEIQECLDILDGKDVNPQLIHTSISLAAEIYAAVEKITKKEAKQQLVATLNDGTAKQSFVTMLEQQGANIIDDKPDMPDSPEKVEILSSKTGVINTIKVEEIGLISAALGANRFSAQDRIYHDVGIEVCVHYGDYIKKGEPLAYIRYGEVSKQRLQNTPEIIDNAKQRLEHCWEIV